MLLLEYDITKKKQVNKTNIQLEFEANNNKKYKVERIHNNIIYAKKLKAYLPSFYYLVL